MIKGKTIICFSGTNWEMPWGMPQKIMTRLSRSNKIIYIEYQPSFVHCIFGGMSYIKYMISGRGRMENIDENIRVYKPRPGLPFNNYIRLINMFNQLDAIRAVKEELKGIPPQEVIIWAFVPYAIDLINALDSYYTIYHCAGNYAEEKKSVLRKNTVVRMEMDILKRSDLVIAQTESLKKRFETLGKAVYYMPSAVDMELFGLAVESSPETKDRIDASPIPRIGVVGYFDDTFYDTDLLVFLMEARRDWSFIFIGPLTGRARGFKRLLALPNAHFIGNRPPREMPGLIRKMDVCIIPYKVNNYMNEVSPTKYYEYLACGKPVVSTPLPDLKGDPKVLRIARDRKGFLGHLDDILTGSGNYEDAAKRLAGENSLDKHLETFFSFAERKGMKI